MKAAIVLAAGACFARSVGASNPEGVVSWNIERRNALTRDVRMRASTFEEVITNELQRGGYFATCSVGNPGQNLTLQLDTGSSDTWVPHVDAKACKETQGNPEGCTYGTCSWKLVPHRESVTAVD